MELAVDKHSTWKIAAGIVACCLGFTATAVAQHENATFSSKTVHVVIGYAAGTGNDILGRLVTRHLGKHIPGTNSRAAEHAGCWQL